MRRTTDGGVTWTRSQLTSYQGLGRLQFLPAGDVGWMVAGNVLYRSNDKGQSWTQPVGQTTTPMNWISDFQFLNSQQGWAVNSYPAYPGNASIFRTGDGGSTWSAVPDTPYRLNGVRFVDAQHGVAVGEFGLALVTTDGGQTWVPRATGVNASLRRVVFVDAQTVVAVGDGGSIIRSTDRGQTWQRVSRTSDQLTDVFFASATSGWAVGNNGAVLATVDGGGSWVRQNTGSSKSFNAAFFTDEATGWIVSSDGAILATATGGR